MTAAADFIRAHLPLRPVTGVPEIRLHQATPSSGVWRLAGAGGGSPYWAYAWGGGLALARYLLDQPAAVAGKRAFDLGSGSGLVAIAAALAGAAAVEANDIDPYAWSAIGLNAEANEVRVTVNQDDRLDGAAPEVDLVLIGDVFYDAALAGRSAAFARRCLAAGVEVLVGDPWRAPLPRDQLVEVARYDVADFGDMAPKTSSAVFRWRAAPADQ